MGNIPAAPMVYKHEMCFQAFLSILNYHGNMVAEDDAIHQREASFHVTINLTF